MNRKSPEKSRVVVKKTLPQSKSIDRSSAENKQQEQGNPSEETSTDLCLHSNAPGKHDWPFPKVIQHF